MKNLGFKFVGALALAAFLGGCGTSIEAPLVSMEEAGYGTRLIVQSKDNNTIVEEVIVNKGNCGVLEYTYDRKFYADDDNSVARSKAFLEKHFVAIKKIKKNGGQTEYEVTFKNFKGDTRTTRWWLYDDGITYEKVFQNYSDDLANYISDEILKEIYSGGRSWHPYPFRQMLEIYSNNATSAEYLEKFNALDENTKALYVKKTNNYGKVIPFGNSRGFGVKCDMNKIIEVELVTNGGTFTYEFNQY